MSDSEKIKDLESRILKVSDLLLSEISDIHLALGNVEMNTKFPESHKALKASLKNKMEMYAILRSGKSTVE